MIGQYLKGQKVVPPQKPYNCSKGELETIDQEDYAEVEHIERAQMPALQPEDRKHTFAEIDTGISEETARREAGRCLLSCGCLDVFECKLRELATEYRSTTRITPGGNAILPSRPMSIRPFLETRTSAYSAAGA